MIKIIFFQIDVKEIFFSLIKNLLYEVTITFFFTLTQDIK